MKLIVAAVDISDGGVTVDGVYLLWHDDRIKANIM